MSRKDWWTDIRQRAGLMAIDGTLESLSRIGRLHPASRPERHHIEVIRDIPYIDDGDPSHTLDVYRPENRDGPLPTAIYFHGGGFRILSKNTHWLMGLLLARQSMVVFNVNYRLIPRYPFPMGLADCCAAYAWIHRNASTYGGDPREIHLAGESAGANLVVSLVIASSFKRPEPWTDQVFRTPVGPRTAIPACGILQVTDPERFWRHRRLSLFMKDRLRGVSDAYLPHESDVAQEVILADPLLFLEQCGPPDRPMPAFFAFVGTRDPLLDDTRRLEQALNRLGVPCQARYYPGGIHAFHALYFTRLARRCWQDQFDFLADHRPVKTGGPAR